MVFEVEEVVLFVSLAEAYAGVPVPYWARSKATGQPRPRRSRCHHTSSECAVVVVVLVWGKLADGEISCADRDRSPAAALFGLVVEVAQEAVAGGMRLDRDSLGCRNGRTAEGL